MTTLQPPKKPDPKQCQLDARTVNEALPMPVPTAGRSSGGAAELGTILSGVYNYLSGKSKEKDCLKQQEMQYQKEVKEYNFQAETYISTKQLQKNEKTGKFNRAQPAPIVEPVPEPVFVPAPRPAPITPQFVNVQGQLIGKNGVVQEWIGGGWPDNSSGSSNGIDRDSSGSTGCHNDLNTGQCRPDTCYDLKF